MVKSNCKIKHADKILTLMQIHYMVCKLYHYFNYMFYTFCKKSFFMYSSKNSNIYNNTKYTLLIASKLLYDSMWKNKQQKRMNSIKLQL